MGKLQNIIDEETELVKEVQLLKAEVKKMQNKLDLTFALLEDITNFLKMNE